MIMIKIYSLFDFESFELLDIFDDFDYEIKEPKSNDEMLDDLFENEDFKKVYNRILDHFFKHRKSLFLEKLEMKVLCIYHLNFSY